MAHIHEKYDFTVSAFVLHPSEPKILLHMHKKLNSWMQPGGHVELDEDPEQALWREMKEETGLSRDDLTLLTDQPSAGIRNLKVLPNPYLFNVHDYSSTHKHIDLCYVLRASTDKIKPAEGESTETGWFSLDEIITKSEKDEVFDNTLDVCTLVLGKFS